MRKEKAMQTVQELPAEFDVDELIEKLIFIEKVENGLKELDKGKTKSHKQVKALVKKWRK